MLNEAYRMNPKTVSETLDIETVAVARPGDTLGYARVSTLNQCLSEFGGYHTNPNRRRGDPCPLPRLSQSC